MSTDPTNDDYTKALSWVLATDWARVAWVVNAKKTYKAVAHDHRNDNKFQRNTRSEVVLAEGNLININQEYPRQHSLDRLSPGYKVRLGKVYISQGKVTWYRKDIDGVWTKCADPRPMAD